jgi:hypothetical protein
MKGAGDRTASKRAFRRRGRKHRGHRASWKEWTSLPGASRFPDRWAGDRAPGPSRRFTLPTLPELR